MQNLKSSLGSNPKSNPKSSRDETIARGLIKAGASDAVIERLLPGRFNADDIAKFRATQPAKPKPTAVSLRLASEPWRELLYDE